MILRNSQYCLYKLFENTKFLLLEFKNMYNTCMCFGEIKCINIKDALYCL